MQLVADRFAVDAQGRAVDLATGDSVVLRVGSAGGVSDQIRWTDRCSTLIRLQHRAIAPLVDFGIVGEASRFEAWACGSIWGGADAQAAAMRDVATRFLSAVGLTAGTFGADAVRCARDGSASLLPDEGTGYPLDAARTTNHLTDATDLTHATHATHPTDAADMPLCDRGLLLVDRSAVAPLAEMFRTPAARSRVCALWGPAGAGKRTIVSDLARTARANGFVPVAARLMSSPYAELWQGRSLFVIADNHAGLRPSPWAAFLDATLRGPQPHVLLIVGPEECRSVDGVAAGRLAADTLIAAIRPQAMSARLEAIAGRAAERAHGIPGRFARLLWPRRIGEQDDNRAVRRRSLPRVAELTAVYGVEEVGNGVLPAPPSACAWPAPGELAALRRKRDSALAQLAHGRYAPGIRVLRQAIGGLARRSDWTDAADATLLLANALLRRGRPRDALAAVDEGRDYAGRAGHDAMLLDLAILGGAAWTDLARSDEAESVLGTALAASRVSRDPVRIGAASTALARCLFWRSQYAEAQAALGVPSDAAPASARLRQSLLAARIAVALGDVPSAMRRVAELLAAADASGTTDGGPRAAVAYAAGFVHLAAGDYAAVQQDVLSAVAAARAAHDPVRAVRARLLGAEAHRRAGRLPLALADLQRFRRVMATMPPILRARYDLSLALAGNAADPHQLIARRVASTGLGALALYIGDHKDRAASSGADAFVDEVVAIVRVCQTADEEAVVLRDVCTRVRQQLRAAAVAFVTVRAGGGDVIACDGARLDTGIAERAAAAGIAIAPHRHDDRIEAAAPVHYGGAPIGALCARWTLGSTDDTSRAVSILTMSAAAAAPVLSAAIARELRVASAPTELLGVTPAMVELRKSVERAASAPFGVLVDGESGSGKELVARAIHRGSTRRQRPFCTLNCAALPDDLVEAELFGHARGAFTGAAGERAGVFEEAHGGTLFLDEIGELAPRAQAKVLRVIQEGELRRLGENISRRVDIRLVAATNRDLRREVEAGRFRLDLLYRLDVVHITVPPLRERREDIALLAEHFWREAAERVGSRATLDAATVAALARYDWPGNVRELQNVLAALAVRCPKRGVIPPAALPAIFGGAAGGAVWRLEHARRTFEERFVRAALVRTGGHRGRAAAELGVTRQGLTKLLTRLGITSTP